MSQTRLIVTGAVGLWIAVILQQSISVHLTILGARPDFMLLFVLPMTLITSRPGGTVLGFFAGFLQGAAVGVHLAHYIASLTVAGFLGSWSRAIGLHVNWGVAAVTTLILTIVARLFWMFLAGPHEPLKFLEDTIGTAMYNGVLAIPVYMLLQRILNPKVRSGLR